ncbi:MAG: hypothetical protein AB1461_18455 [Thermodesulfobacteriota bacterium]
MPSQLIEFEKMFSVREAAVFLRNLAENIENTKVVRLKEIDIDMDEKQRLEIGIKRHEELIMLKVKVKCSLPEMPREMEETVQWRA